MLCLQVIYKDVARRLKDWMREGIPELGDSGGLGIGRTTHTVLHHKNYLEDPHGVCGFNSDLVGVMNVKFHFKETSLSTIASS